MLGIRLTWEGGSVGRRAFLVEDSLTWEAASYVYTLDDVESWIVRYYVGSYAITLVSGAGQMGG